MGSAHTGRSANEFGVRCHKHEQAIDRVVLGSVDPYQKPNQG